MRKKWFSNRNQISILETFYVELKKYCESNRITIMQVTRTHGYVVYEYCDKGKRKEELLYAIKSIYESELKK